MFYADKVKNMLFYAKTARIEAREGVVGEKMSIKAGGMLNISGKDTGDIYGIQKQEFHQTYAPCDENGLNENFSC